MLEVYTKLSDDCRFVNIMAELKNGGQEPIEVARVSAAAFEDTEVQEKTRELGMVLGAWVVKEITQDKDVSITVHDNTPIKFPQN